MTGHLEKLEAKKQFGFIRVPNGDSYFFHRDDFQGHWMDLCADYTLSKPIQVDFQEGRTSKGLRARNVSRLDFPNQSTTEVNGNVSN